MPRPLLRPSKALNRLVLGVLARAARLHHVGVCAFVFLSNHCHLLQPLGVRRILHQNPHSRPQRPARSKAPRFHTATWEIRKMLEAMYREYRAAYAEAMHRLASGSFPVRFPRHGIPPPVIRAASPA